MKNKIQKVLSILTITTLLFTQVAAVSAFEAPTPPPTPTLNESQTPPPTPSDPTPPPEPTVPTLENLLAPSPTPTPEETNTKDEETKPAESSEIETLSTTNSSPQSLPTDNNSFSADTPSTSGPEANGSVGDTTLDTGNATTTGNLTTSANENLSSATPSGSGDSGTTVTNSGNGSESQNSATVSDTSSIDTIQDNTANVGNDLRLDSDSGNSSASKNVGNTTITTGDANTSGTVVTELNSNLAGLSVSEFNVVDDQLGDLLLDFAGSCIIGCEVFNNALVQNKGNGSESTNSANLTTDSTNNTFQNNDATLENNLLLTSNSGENTADKNTGGDTTIETGDANTSANVLSFLNNNVAGNVLMGVVNIFGDLIGDIIFPELPGGSLLEASNIGNGSDSTNTANINQTSANDTFQSNDAEIVNNLNLQATTGDNQTSKNTGGDTSITTGDADVVAQVLNIANSNISSGNWWLVLVNEAGQWAGRILGAPEDSNFAGSEGTQFSVDGNGDVTASNIGNGSGSTNDTTVNQSSSTTTVQNNVARILNNINLFANSGGNSASSNTGGNTSIQTGDANAVANLVNFVNNNIVGSGRLTVVSVNVFGRWIGDFLSPGQTKPKALENNTTEQQNTNSQDNSTTTTLSNPPSQNNSPTNSTPQNQATQTQTATPPPSSGNAPSVVQVAKQTVATITQPLETQVAGIKVLASNELANLQDKTVEKKKIKINLAWGLLLLPLMAGGLTLRKYYTYKKGLGN